MKIVQPNKTKRHACTHTHTNTYKSWSLVLLPTTLGMGPIVLCGLYVFHKILISNMFLIKDVALAHFSYSVLDYFLVWAYVDLVHIASLWEFLCVQKMLLSWNHPIPLALTSFHCAFRNTFLNPKRMSLMKIYHLRMIVP